MKVFLKDLSIDMCVLVEDEPVRRLRAIYINQNTLLKSSLCGHYWEVYDCYPYMNETIIVINIKLFTAAYCNTNISILPLQNTEITPSSQFRFSGLLTETLLIVMSHFT